MRRQRRAPRATRLRVRMRLLHKNRSVWLKKLVAEQIPEQAHPVASRRSKDDSAGCGVEGCGSCPSGAWVNFENQLFDGVLRLDTPISVQHRPLSCIASVLMPAGARAFWTSCERHPTQVGDVVDWALRYTADR